MIETPSPLVLTGRTQEHLAASDSGGVLLHRQVIAPFARLQARAARAGINLQIASGFRSFDRQLQIWNAKAAGARPVLDARGEPLDILRLSDREKVHAILRWSALPGASRHHWGTDVDVWDPAAVAADYRLQLTGREYAADGPFARLAAWLTDVLAEPGAEFYRPFYSAHCERESDGAIGVAPEPWHLSYRPLAFEFAAALSPQLLAEALAPVAMNLKATVLAELETIYARYVVTGDCKRESAGS